MIGSAAFPSVPPGGGSLLCSRAPSWLDGSESGGLCIHDCGFFLRAEFPEQNNIMVPILWIVFYGFSEALSLAQNYVKAVLEALQRYLSVV